MYSCGALTSARDIADESSPISLLWFVFFNTVELLRFLHWSLLLATPIFSLVTSYSPGWVVSLRHPPAEIWRLKLEVFHPA